MSTAAPTSPAETAAPNTPAKAPAQALTAVGDNWWDDSGKFALIQRAGRMFAMSPLVPEQYQGEAGIPSCVIALNIANRLNADPLMVMQNLYIVHGRPGWSAQFLIACFNQTGRFRPIRYRFVGTEGRDDWGCVAYSKERQSGEDIEGPLVTIKTAKDEGWFGKKGSKWQTTPRLMLMYRAAAWLVRTHAPELTMGLQTVEEVKDTIDAEFVRVRPGLPDVRGESEKVADMLDSKRSEKSTREQLEDRIFACTSADDVAAAAKAVADADIDDGQREYLEGLLSQAEQQVSAK